MAPPECAASVKAISLTVSPKVAHFRDTVKQAKLKGLTPLSRREQGRAEREPGGRRGRVKRQSASKKERKKCTKLREKIYNTSTL